MSTLHAAMTEEWRRTAQELLNATEGYDHNVKQVLRAGDALRGAADEIDRLRAVVEKRLGWDTWGNEALEHVSLAAPLPGEDSE